MIEEAGISDLRINQGAYFEKTYTVSAGDPLAPVNFTGWTGEAYFTDGTGTKHSFTITLNTIGEIKLELTDVQTGAIPAPGTTYQEMQGYSWELLLTPPSLKKQRYLNGIAYVSPKS